MPHEHHHMLAYATRREIGEIYASMAIRQLGMAMYSLFEPVYLYQLFNDSVMRVALFYVVIVVLYAVFVPIGTRFVTWFGVKRSMLLSVPFLFLYIVGLYFLPDGGTALLVGVIGVNVIYKILFWSAFHIDFAMFSSKEKRGQQAGMLQFVMYASRVAGPLLGGLILAFGGFPTLFLVVLIVLLTSVIPLFLSREVHETYSLSLLDTLWTLFRKENIRHVVAYAAQGAENKIGQFIWPLFLFALLEKFTSMGAVTSVVLFVAAIVSIGIGKMSDRWSVKTMLRIGSLLNASAWALRSLIQSNFQLIAFDSYGRVSQRTVYIPFISIFYDRAQRKGSGVDEYIMVREVPHNIGGGIGILIAAWLFLATGSFVATFLATAAISLAFMLLKK